MTILIDIPMPESCHRCPCSFHVFNGHLCKAFRSKTIEELRFYKGHENKPEWCPLKEVKNANPNRTANANGL